ncbi:replication region DNA-binding N-term [Duganella sp. CF517]|uniref:DNA-binding protein n=1 Tax=Duganella sp. CF517 TaxID=1881038 RepID=UPI0008AF725E|nr:DNA-binding protein [Duganella sp. CF517]SEO53559.1 replication region DNA-binding N-term [Duganella sp. CF517]
MSRQEVTAEQVASAADGLQRDGTRVTIEAVSALLDGASVNAVHKHLTAWRARNAKPAAAPKLDIPEPIAVALGKWAQQLAEEAGVGARDALAQSEEDMEVLLKSGEQFEAEREELLAQVAGLTAERDEALATLVERGEEIDQLQAELRNARHIATDALVGKAKDQLAIEGKDSQLADLRAQIERNVAAAAALSDARLKAEMELVGAVTARDSFAAEIKELRAKLASRSGEARRAE